MELSVQIERVIYPKEDAEAKGGWMILATNRGVCKGVVKWRPREMETLKLSGEYTEYKGQREFQFKGAKLSLPTDAKAQLDYVCERTKGIGAELTEAIWNARGEDWRGLARKEVKGMSDGVFNNFVEQINAFDDDKEKAETIAWLESKGASNAMAAAAWEAWESDTMGLVNADCFRLAELTNFSFRAVDMKIRANFGIADDDKRRLRAGIIYSLNQLTSDGSTVIGVDLHKAEMMKLLCGVSPELITEVAGELIHDGTFKIFDRTVSYYKDFGMERDIYAFVHEAAAVSEDGALLEKASDWLDKYQGNITPDEQQKKAVKMAIGGKFAMINGGAGTGKTTIIDLIYKVIKEFKPNVQIELCALAGKAAARLKEATRKPARTIHSMMGYNGECFSRTSLSGVAVIIDEASMVDIWLLSEIVRARPEMLILVGDQAQLPPVGKGQPFHDLLEILPGRLITLQCCYRNQEAVFDAAMKIRKGEMPPMTSMSSAEQWDVTLTGDALETQSVILKWIKQGFLDFDTDIVLCPKNGKIDDASDENYSPATVNALNMAIAGIVNPGDRGENGRKIIEGDRVINVKNYAEKDVWNGTTGTVEKINDKGEMFIRLDTPIIDKDMTYDLNDPKYTDIIQFTKDMVKTLKLAYALTVHKSQGSQYRRVVMVCLSRDVFNLDRSMIYTGVTRTREHCVIAGDSYALQRGIDTIKAKSTVLQCLALTVNN